MPPRLTAPARSLRTLVRSLCTPPARHHSSFSSVNPDEIAHFESLASSWWDPYGPSRILHLMNPPRHDFIHACRIQTPPPPPSLSPGDNLGYTRRRNLRYLDVGCGGGIFAESAARLPTTAHVTGIDPSAAVLGVARAHARQDPMIFSTGHHSASEEFAGSEERQQQQQQQQQQQKQQQQQQHPRLRYIRASIETLPVPASISAQYDVVTLFEVLEHVSSPQDVLARAAPFVRPGGWLVASTIARTWASWVTTKVLAEDLLRVVPRGTHSWDKYIDEAELRAMLLSGEQRGRGADRVVVDGDGRVEGEEIGNGGKERELEWKWGSPTCRGVVYVPGLGWRELPGVERLGNYFFAVRKELVR